MLRSYFKEIVLIFVSKAYGCLLRALGHYNGALMQKAYASTVVEFCDNPQHFKTEYYLPDLNETKCCSIFL